MRASDLVPISSRILRPRREAGVGIDEKLALAEFMLGTVSLEASAQRGLEWLVEHGDVQQAVLAVVDASGKHLTSISEYGLSPATPWEFSVDLENRSHPFVHALRQSEPVFFHGSANQPWTPLESGTYYAIPLRSSESRQQSPDGLLLVSTSDDHLSAEARWAAEILGQQIVRLRSREVLAETRFGRERMLLYSIINAVTDPILLTDPDGKLITANTRAEKLLAAPDDASEGWRQAVALNNMLFSAALSSSAVEAEEPSRRELVLVDPIEGSDLLFELLSSVVKVPREGTFVVSILRNVTDLGRATEELEEIQRRLRTAQADSREERHRLELIIDSVADPILVTDPVGDIVLMNAPAERLFTTGDESKDIQRRVRANGAHFSSFVSNLLFSGTDDRLRGEVNLLEPGTGDSMPFEALAGKVLSEQGEVIWFVTILHDRREAFEKARLFEQLKLASEELESKVRVATGELAQQNELLRRQALELEQASALKSQFLANMSHEFRTPLNAILGYTQMLLQGVAGPLSVPQQKNLSRVDANSRHLLALINDILDITRIEAGRMPLNVTDFKISGLVDEVMSELEPIVALSHNTVRTDLQSRLPPVRSDRQKVKQILLNLLSNALKFTQHGSVTITATERAESKSISISVTDTGVGIGEVDQERVFEDFRQLNNSTSRGYGGTGLGLSICRRLASVLGGRLTLQSALGEGSTFTLHLPIRLRRR